MTKINQKNFWLPVGMIENLDGVVAALNQGVEKKINPSDIAREALERFLSLGVNEIRKAIQDRHVRMLAGPAKSVKVDVGPDALIVAQGMMPKPPKKVRRKKGA